MGSNVQIIEVVWVVEMTVGLGFSIWNVIDSYRDRKDIVLMPNGLKDAAMLTANGSLWTEVLRTSQLALLDLAGILFLFRPAPPSDRSAIALFVAALFLIFGAALMANTILTTRTRIRILKALGVRRVRPGS